MNNQERMAAHFDLKMAEIKKLIEAQPAEHHKYLRSVMHACLWGCSEVNLRASLGHGVPLDVIKAQRYQCILQLLGGLAELQDITREVMVEGLGQVGMTIVDTTEQAFWPKPEDAPRIIVPGGVH